MDHIVPAKNAMLKLDSIILGRGIIRMDWDDGLHRTGLLRLRLFRMRILRIPQSLNLYTFVRNIPTTKYDTDGHEVYGQVDVDLNRAANALTQAFHATVSFLTTAPPPHMPTAGGPLIFVPCTCSLPERTNNNKNNNSKQNNNSKSNNQQEQGGQKQGAQDKALSKGEIKQLEKNAGQTAHDIKGDIVGKNVSKYDLYKNANGEIVVKPKGVPVRVSQRATRLITLSRLRLRLRHRSTNHRND